MIHVENVTIDPNAAFGMLLAAEGGASLEQMAHVFGLGRSSILTVLDSARRGEAGKVEACNGDVRVPMDRGRSAGPVAADRQEVLVQRWMRRIARHMHRYGAVSAQEIRDYLGEGRAQHASVSMDAFRQQFAALGLNFTDKPRKGTLPTRLQLDFQSQQLLAAIIADDWKIEVER